ncbi:unnamed protein product [Schistosoma margrebowiei]|uniref:Uncharacterized protein n=1 Tax=Schistosoma margrebowiei TaxID=48269 RepID=A0A183N954_9TREM|nr:unnamed protein product [Schistosoma margrebowiei]
MSANKPTNCIDEVKENFRWTIEKHHKYSSISESTENQHKLKCLNYACFAVNNNKKTDAPENSQFACNSPDATDFDAQLCCLQKQEDFKRYNEKVSGPLKGCFCQGKVSCSTAFQISTLKLIVDLYIPLFVQNIAHFNRISLKTH